MSRISEAVERVSRWIGPPELGATDRWWKTTNASDLRIILASHKRMKEALEKIEYEYIDNDISFRVRTALSDDPPDPTMPLPFESPKHV